MDDFYKNLMYNIKDINTILTGEPEDVNEFCKGGGCTAKLGPGILDKVLKMIPKKAVQEAFGRF